jgi:hypothetical protein
MKADDCIRSRPNPYVEHKRNPIQGPAQGVKATRKDKETIAALKQEREILRGDAKRNEDKIHALGDENKKLYKSVETWRKLYQSIRDTKDENDQEAFYQYEERLRVEKDKDDVIEQMAQQIICLRSDIEEAKITEDEICGLWDDLLSKIQGCTGSIGWHLGQSDGWTRKDKILKLLLKFDSPIFEQMSIVDYFLPAELLRLVMAAAGRHLYPTLTQWSDSERNEPGTLGLGLDSFEREIMKLLETSMTSGQPPQKVNMGSQQGICSLISLFPLSSFILFYFILFFWFR